jgi:hypothetical protein
MDALGSVLATPALMHSDTFISTLLDGDICSTRERR